MASLRALAAAPSDLSRLIIAPLARTGSPIVQRSASLAAGEDGVSASNSDRGSAKQKAAFADGSSHQWEVVDPDRFSTQIKRIHEYKRQILNVLHVVILYNRLRQPEPPMTPHTFFFAGKGPLLAFPSSPSNSSITFAAPSMAIRRLAAAQILFLPEYNVSLAERAFGSDVSEQISTAVYEASGTGNMKFMMNGALDQFGTRDGATIEMPRKQVRKTFSCRLTGAEVEAAPAGTPSWHYATNLRPEKRSTNLLRSLQSQTNPVFSSPSVMRCWTTAIAIAPRDLASLCPGTHRTGSMPMRMVRRWSRKAVINVDARASSRAIARSENIAGDIWNLKPSPVT